MLTITITIVDPSTVDPSTVDSSAVDLNVQAKATRRCKARLTKVFGPKIPQGMMHSSQIPGISPTQEANDLPAGEYDDDVSKEGDYREDDAAQLSNEKHREEANRGTQDSDFAMESIDLTHDSEEEEDIGEDEVEAVRSTVNPWETDDTEAIKLISKLPPIQCWIETDLLIHQIYR
jgi:hypothetical protein